MNEPTEKTFVAKRVEKLRGSVLEVIKKRDRRPHPLFWSLFQTEVKEIRSYKEQSRLVRKILLGIDS